MNDNIEKAIKGSEDCLLIVSKNGTLIKGSLNEVLSMYYTLSEHLINNSKLTKKDLKKIIDINIKEEE